MLHQYIVLSHSFIMQLVIPGVPFFLNLCLIFFLGLAVCSPWTGVQPRSTKPTYTLTSAHICSLPPFAFITGGWFKESSLSV